MQTYLINIKAIKNSFYVCVGVISIFIIYGCSLEPSRQVVVRNKKIISYTSNQDYRQFIQENQKNINLIYSSSYEDYEFIVDSESGGVRIQNLIDPDMALSIIEKTVKENQSNNEKATACYHYILKHYNYVAMPEKWASVETTLRTQKGDCKSFSLLLLSVLISFDMDCYAAVSNGHMWVEAKLSNKWTIFETDSDVNRNLVYQSPGFYEKPMFKIYKDRSEKRIRIKKRIANG